MSTNSDEETISFGENQVRKKKNQEKSDWRKKVKEVIRSGNIEIERGGRENYINLINITRDFAWPMILESPYTDSKDDYHMELDEDDGYTWDWMAIEMFRKNHDEYLQELSSPSNTSISDHLGLELAPSTEAREYTKRCFRSLEAILEYEGIIGSSLKSETSVLGYSDIELGVLKKSYEMELGDPVRAVKQGELVKSLFVGGTNAGKSATASTEAEDRYNAGNKIIDLIDKKKFENGVYDLPQSSEEMRNIRERMELPVDFTESDIHKNPDLELLHPLTTELYDINIPVEEGGEGIEDSVFDVFTIPASEIPKNVLITYIDSMLTSTMKTSLSTAYSEVDKKDDWTLKDLAEQIRNQNDIESDAARNRITNVLKMLQNNGYIRDKSCPHSLDMDEVMHNNDTITSFTQVHMSAADRLIIQCYIIDKIIELRSENSSTSDKKYPDLTVVMRELHSFVPHQRLTVSDQQGESLQKNKIPNLFKDLLMEQGHIRVDLIADTQVPTHLNKNARTGFNRYVILQLDESDLKNVLGWTQGASKSAYKKLENNLTSKAGEAGIVGQTEPTTNSTSLSYISPIKYAPPSWHHIDREVHDDGFECRVELTDEELQPLDIKTELPEEYAISFENEIDKDKPPIQSFIDNCIEVTEDPNDYVIKSDVRTCYARFASEFSLPPKHKNETSFGMNFSKNTSDSVKADQRKGEQVYLGIKLSDMGKKLLLEED